MAVDIETARIRASRIGAASASMGDFHSLFESHNADETTLLAAERIALVFCASALFVAVEPRFQMAAFLLLLGLTIVCFVPASRYLPGLQRYRNENLMAMNIRINLALLPILFGVLSFAFLGTISFPFLMAPLFVVFEIDTELLNSSIGAGAIAGISAFLFIYFRWARKRCHNVWSET